MKKLICILLSLLLLTACGTEPAAETTGTAAPTEAPVVSARVGDEEILFEPWEQDGLPTEGTYHLTRDVVMTEPLNVTGQLRLHLNGFTVSTADGVNFGSMFTVKKGGELLLCDKENGTGVVLAPRSFSAIPVVLHVFQVEGTMTLAGGKVDASAISLENISNGAGFLVSDGGVLNVAGGTVVGGSTICYSLDPDKNVTPDTLGNTGETEETEPVETVPEETEPAETEPVTEEEVQPHKELLGKGGSVYLAAGAVCNVTGGEITGGIGGLGGNFFVEAGATLSVENGVISDGESIFHGGNIYNEGTVRMSSGELLRGRASNHGGNIYVVGTLEVTGGSIVEGRCDANSRSGKRGGNILVNGLEAVVKISNCRIIDGNGQGSENFGGNISVIGQCAREFSVTDSTISGGIGHRGGNLYFGTLAKDVNPENLDFYMSNVTVSGGTCSYRGANLCMDSDLRDVYVNLVMDNCIIQTDEAGRENVSLGAGAALYTWATLTMNGGKLEGGNLTLYQDSILTTNGTEMTMNTEGTPGTHIHNP